MSVQDGLRKTKEIAKKPYSISETSPRLYINRPKLAMDDIIRSSELEGVDSISSIEPDSRCRNSSKRRSKTRSKVWEKVAWFTRKAKSSRENKVESPEEARKDEKYPSLSGLRSGEDEETNELVEVNSNVSKLTSSSFCKTKTKSGIRKTRSFNYLKRKKLKHYANEAGSSFIQAENKENADPTSSTCQTATGNFHDFASFGRKCSNGTNNSTLLVSEMAKQMNFKQKQEEQLKEGVRSSLSLPLSLLSLNEIHVSDEVCSQSCQGLVCNCMPRNKSFSGPSYNSWPRKKRLLTANQSYEAFSPPQKQKRTRGLRKTATFSGFDSSKLCLNLNKRELQMGKSTPLLSGNNQIKNQNGLTIGVIHFFKSSRNEYSIVSKDESASGAILQINEVKNLNMCSTKQTSDANTDLDVVGNNGISDPLHSSLHLEAKIPENAEELSAVQSDLLDNGFFGENEQCGDENRDNTKSICKDLAESANTSAIVSTQKCFVVKDPFIEVTCLTSHNYQTSQHQENVIQSNALEKGIQQLQEYLSPPSVNEQIRLGSKPSINSSDARTLDQVDLNSLQELGVTDKRTAYAKLDVISEIPDTLADSKSIGSSKEYNELSTTQTEDTLESNQASKAGIYCIKIEDQVTDFSKEGKIDFQAQTKLHSASTLSNPVIEELCDNTYMKENPLFQSADNSNTSDNALSAMTNGSAAEEIDETAASERNTFNDHLVMPSNMVMPDEGKIISKNDGGILPNIESVNSNSSFKARLKTPAENKIQGNQNNDILGSSLQQTSQKLLKQGKPRVDGPHFKHQTEVCLSFSYSYTLFV